MRNCRGLAILAAATILALWATAAQAVVVFDWATVADGGNNPDDEVMVIDGTTGDGSVANTYRISKTEVSAGQVHRVPQCRRRHGRPWAVQQQHVVHLRLQDSAIGLVGQLHLQRGG